MKRRDFLKISAPLSLSPLFFNGMSLKAFATPAMMQTLGCEAVTERVLVLVQLKGGNDGFNTLVPINQYDEYAALRPDIRLLDTGNPAEAFIPLDSTLPNERLTGLHPAMIGLKTLYDQGKASFINGVGYPSANKSHFKSTDLWLTGGDGTPANFSHSTGWVGRYLDHSFPGIAGNPTTEMPDPLGIELGDRKPSLGFHTEGEHRTSINLTGQDPSGFFNVVSEIGNAPIMNPPASEYGDILQHVMNIENSISVYSERISNVFDAGTNVGSYPASRFANQLKTVARLMSGGCRTKVYLVNLGGFDTHNNQIQFGATHEGNHANLLGELSEAMAAFQTDLEGLGLEDRVMTATFSEFGRKAIQNGSFGTDHGTLAPMLVFGKHLEAGVFGEHVDLQNLDNTGAPAQTPVHDYRQVFTSLIQDWLGASDLGLETTYFDPFGPSKLPLITANQVVPEECYDPFIQTTGVAGEISLGVRAFPNPTASLVQIDFVMQQALSATITLRDMQGRLLQQQQHNSLPGPNRVVLDLYPLPAGVYFCEIQHPAARQTVKLVKQ